MKLSSTCSDSRRGVALIIVLALLVLVLGLTVTFLSRAGIERTASSGYAAASSNDLLADTVVNLVQGQIRDATTQGPAVAWASQPGMVRTFATGSPGNYAPSSQLLRAYKLYSAAEMTSADAGTLLTADAPPAGWALQPALWTDLNDPVFVGGNASYPILDPGASGSVEGFAITGAPTQSTSNAAPMPVRWLYVLADGTIVTPDGSSGDPTIPGADSSDRKIVGRIAFWTDDETAKININTASEGTMWDAPRTTSQQDKTMATNQPASNEYQRYPGHPAMTSLAPALFASNATFTPVLSKVQRDAIYSITPRVTGGGSDAGTTRVINALVPDKDRLYTSVDEMIFNAGRNSQVADAGLNKTKLERLRFFLTATSRAPEITLFNTPRVSIWPLDLQDNANYRSALDRLFAFVSTINPRGEGGNPPQPYYFQRSDPRSLTADWINIIRNRELFGYLQALSGRAFPGFGGDSLNTKYGTDRDQILTEIFDYIRLTNPDDALLAAQFRFGYRAQLPPIDPAVGSQRAGHNQIVPLRIQTAVGSNQGFGRFPVISEVGVGFIATADAGNGMEGGVANSNRITANATAVPPYGINKTLGGTLLNAGERRIEAILMLETFVPGQGYPHVMQSFVIRVKDGLDALSVTDSTGVPKNLGFPDNQTALMRFGMWQHSRRWGGVNSMNSFFASNYLPARGVMPADNPPSGSAVYPFVGIPITVVVGPFGTMTFNGGTFTIEVYNRTLASEPGYTPGETPVSTLSVTLPPSTIPVPNLIDKTVAGVAAPGWWSFSRDGAVAGTGGRFSRAGGETTGYSGDRPGRAAMFVRTLDAVANPKYDVVRSVHPRGSDYRLPMVAGEAAFSNFEKNVYYDTATEPHAHTFVQGAAPSYSPGVSMTLGSTAKLVTGLSYWNQAAPDVGVAHTNSNNLRDFDNGLATTVDGAYINLPDTGNNTADPYFNMDSYTEIGGSLFSPNRQVPSPGMFGSLPSKAKAGVPWRTLLFRPHPGHPGSAAPHDHLWTDFFWMPVVEPYAISEPFSTAGKINMNYQIAPFTYIRRATAMVAALRPELMTVIPDGNVGTTQGYKATNPLAQTTAEFRSTIDAHQTLKQFDTMFSSGNLFRSPSQIMEQWLVPQGQTFTSSAAMGVFWNSRRITGDNSRERPYANLLGRLTTKSNSYTVHYRVQSLQKIPSTGATTWVEGRDRITGEQRGSVTMERYVNPSNTKIPDYAKILAGDPSATPTDLGQFYQWRVLSKRIFAP